MEFLKAHFQAYPRLTAVDVIKLLYQRTYGGEHIVTDVSRVREYLAAEYESVPQTAVSPRIEPLGGGIVRLYLNGIPKDSLDTVSRLFVRGASVHCPDEARLRDTLCEISAAASRGETPFSAEEWESTLAAWREAGCPAVRHSETYRAAYAPAYRIIPVRYVPYLPLLFAVDRLLAERGHAVLAIDGMCGSGKTTFADLLSDLYGAATVRMDDFFLPPPLRTAERLAEAGGNIHYERFAEEVTPHLGTGRTFSYRVFDCSKMAFDGMREVPARALTVVEGSYALHPALCARYDLKAYVSCTADVQAARLRARCANESLFVRFLREWIPMETAYERAFFVRGCADFVIDTTDSEGREYRK